MLPGDQGRIGVRIIIKDCFGVISDVQVEDMRSIVSKVEFA